MPLVGTWFDHALEPDWKTGLPRTRPTLKVDGRWPREDAGTGELRIESVLRAGGVAQHAVDAGTELLVHVALLRRLQVLALLQRARLLGHDVRLDAFELRDEIRGVDDQVARRSLDYYDAVACRLAKGDVR